MTADEYPYQSRICRRIAMMRRDALEPTQTEIDGVAAVFDEVADDPIAQGSAYIMTKKLKRVFVRE